MSDKISVLDEISSCYNDLYDAEKRVADYIMLHSEKVVDMTVAELAEESGCSKATIVRLCKKCGCEGFYHLKIKMAKEMVAHSNVKISNEINVNCLEQSLQNILANKYEELKQTVLNIDTKMLTKMLNDIKKADTVLFAAQGNTIPVALDGAYKFSQIGIKAYTSTIWEHQLIWAHKLQKNDVVIAISASGESKNVLSIVDVAMDNEAKIIALSNSEKSTLALKSDYHIHTISRERLFFSDFSFIMTRLAAMGVIEMLFYLLTSSMTDSHRHIEEHEQSMADDKI